jgi:Rrf2 family transcriptional regulator, cysteine metabolism repressor
MRISTRTRYGLRLMLYLARSFHTGNVFLKDIAKEEDISEKYLSLIIIPLRSAALVKSVRGARGGYSLTREPSKIYVSDIMEVLEGDLDLVECVRDETSCQRSSHCDSIHVWENLSNVMKNYLSSITLEDLIHQNEHNTINYII